MFRVILLVLFCFTITVLKGNEQHTELTSAQLLSMVQEQDIILQYADSLNKPPVKFKRGKAILFTIFTGILGGHRIYLGTHHRTPIIYSLTFGGLGILAFIDLIHIIFTEDLTIFQDKSQMIMWRK
jgi:hypothetical protein